MDLNLIMGCETFDSTSAFYFQHSTSKVKRVLIILMTSFSADFSYLNNKNSSKILEAFEMLLSCTNESKRQQLIGFGGSIFYFC